MTDSRLISVPAWMHPEARAVPVFESCQTEITTYEVCFFEDGLARFVDRLTPVLVERGDLERARG